MKKSTRNSKKVIFIVDDQPLYANILKASIEQPKHEIHLFESGEECMEKMHLSPDVVVLDFELDDGSQTQMNGIEVLKKIKEVNPDCETIMLSGHEDVKIATSSIKFGAYDYVVKNENAIINIKNRMRNIYRKIDILTELKEVKVMKAAIFAIAAVMCVFAVFSKDLLGDHI